MGNMFGGGQQGNMGQMPGVNQQGYPEQQGSMHDQMLGQAMQGQQQAAGGSAHGDMLGLAGLLLASGVRFKDALPMAAQMASQQAHQQQQMYQAQQQQQQQMKLQSLGELIASNPEIGTKQLASELLKSGVPPQNVAAMVNSISPLPNYQIVKDNIYGSADKVFDKTSGRFGTNGASTNNAEAAVTTDRNANEIGTGSVGVGYTGEGMEPGTNKGPAMPSKQNPFKAPNEKPQIFPNTPMDRQRKMEMPKAMPEEPQGGLRAQGQPQKKNIVEDFIDYSAEKVGPQEKRTLKAREIDQRDYNTFKKETIKPYLENAREIERNNGEILESMKHFKTGTGAEQRLAAKKLGAYLGFDVQGAAAGEILEKASNKLVLDYAKQMKGVVSDKDIAFLKQMVPGISITPEGNRKIIGYFDKIAKAQKQYAKSADKFYDKFGTMKGFETYYDDYIQNHQVFADERQSKEYKDVLRKVLEKRESQK